MSRSAAILSVAHKSGNEPNADEQRRDGAARCDPVTSATWRDRHSRRSRRNRRFPAFLNVGDKAIAVAGHSHNIEVLTLPLAECLAERRNMDGEVALLDNL